MAAARYWRLFHVESYLGEGLVLSDVALYASGVRQDASAALSCTVAAVSGAMWTGDVTWADSLPPGFALVWDFGSAQVVDRIDVTGPSQDAFAHKFTVQHCDDGLTWVTLRAITSKFQGAGVVYSYDLTAVYESEPVLLLHGNGANGSQNIVDSGAVPKTITVYGDAKISTAQSKYNGSSLYFDGSGDWVTTPNVSAFNFSSSSTEFTIRGWLRPAGLGTFRGFIGARQNNVGHGWCLYLNSSGYLNTGSVIVGNGYTNRQLHSSQFALDTWTYFALVKTASGYTAFVNGIAGSLLALTGGFDYQSAQPLIVGALGSQGELPFFGYIQDLCIDSVALYTSDFTPPSAPILDPVPQDATPLRPRIPGHPLFVGASAVGDTQIIAPAAPVVIDVEDGGVYRVAGTVKEKALPANTPLDRKVRLHREPDGRPIRETWSDAATGAYTFDYIRGDATYYVTAFDYQHNYRAVIADNLTPEKMP